MESRQAFFFGHPVLSIHNIFMTFTRAPTTYIEVPFEALEQPIPTPTTALGKNLIRAIFHG